MARPNAYTKHPGKSSAWRGAMTHCAYGHEFTAENTYWREDGAGRRQCRACNARRALQSRRRREGAA